MSWDRLSRRSITPHQAKLLNCAAGAGVVVRLLVSARDRGAVIVMPRGDLFRRQTFNGVAHHFAKPTPYRVRGVTVAHDYVLLPLDAPMSARAPGPMLRIASKAER